MYETAKETLMYRTVLWTLWERERVGRFGRMALKRVKYHVWNELQKTLKSPLDCKEIKPINPKSVLNIHRKDWCWSWSSNTLATWCEELTNSKRPWFWARLKMGREGDVRGWDGWMASPTRWTWVWASSRSWWWTGMPGVLQSMVSQRIGHNWVTEQQ